MFLIESGIALPEARARTKKGENRYPFLQMKVGDSFAVPLSDQEKTFELQRKLTSNAYWQTQNMGMKFATRVVRKGDVYVTNGVEHQEKADGVRVWRKS